MRNVHRPLGLAMAVLAGVSLPTSTHSQSLPLEPIRAVARVGLHLLAGEPRPTEDERRFVDLINRERTERGLRPLTIDPVLVRAAREHSQEMRQKNYFGHLSPTAGRRTPMDRYLRALGRRPDYACVGENLYYCSVRDVERGHRALMESPGHRDNILHPPFERVGVGIVLADDGQFWVTQMFLATRKAAETPSSDR